MLRARIDFAVARRYSERQCHRLQTKCPDIIMALWIQNRPAEKCGLSELQVAEHLATLPNDWIIRWGFYYTDNEGISREGDFLILGPQGGLLVLESKGGTLEFNPYTGKWNNADGDNPQYQLEAEWAGVLREIKSQQADRPSLFVGRALAVPAITLPTNATEHHGIDRQWIFDGGNLREFVDTWNMPQIMAVLYSDVTPEEALKPKPEKPAPVAEPRFDFN
jgi:hypothetical protein